jgi:hypothetical protein
LSAIGCQYFSAVSYSPLSKATMPSSAWAYVAREKARPTARIATFSFNVFTP